jgi:murein DD-endopeptidase MepM/ murein hydrolase activator NlpD
MEIRSLFYQDVSSLHPVTLDLSASNERLAFVDLDDKHAFEQFISDEIQRLQGGCGIGGYLEKRVIYRRSAHYETEQEPRNIHLGVDIWLPAGTMVLVQQDARIHSVGINSAYGDYGGTIVLEHLQGMQPMFSLYGHLSHNSVALWRAGDLVRAGSTLGALGSWEENGNWPPHLHFQLIRDMQGMQGDYPGVCTAVDMEKYAANCPNPSPFIV